jgi:hypothetical protein
MAFKSLADKSKDSVQEMLDESKKGRKKKAGTAVMTMADVEKLYAEEAKAAAEAAPVSGGVPMVSLKGEQFQIGETFLPDPLEAIVVAEVMQNIYYDSPYNADNPTSPGCFAMALAVKGAEGQMTSHETSPNRQGGVDFKCQGCEMNQFGSAEIGKGKACSNYRKLALVMTSDPGFKDPDTPLTWATMSLPPTSLGDWGKFVMGLDRVEHRPPHGVVIKFTFDRRNPDANKRKRVIAVGYQNITDVTMAMRVNALRKELIDSGALTRPIPVDNYVPPGSKPTTATAKQGGRRIEQAKKKTPRPRAAPAQTKPGKKQAARF